MTSASSHSAGRRCFFCTHGKSNPTTDDDMRSGRPSFYLSPRTKQRLRRVRLNPLTIYNANGVSRVIRSRKSNGSRARISIVYVCIKRSAGINSFCPAVVVVVVALVEKPILPFVKRRHTSPCAASYTRRLLFRYGDCAAVTKTYDNDTESILRLFHPTTSLTVRISPVNPNEFLGKQEGGWFC